MRDVPVSSIHHVQWCTVVYSGVQWCTGVYSGVQWCTVVYSGVQWCTVVYTSVQWLTLVEQLNKPCDKALGAAEGSKG